MWTRVQLKAEAKTRLVNFYWPAVLISFIVTLFAGGGGGGSNIFNYRENHKKITQPGEWNGYLSSIDYTIIMLGLGIAVMVFILAGLYMTFVGNILQMNENRFYLCSRDYKASLGEIVYGFTNGHYLNCVKIMFLRDLKIFLWSLLFIIPGIIKSYEYYMIPSLLAENPQLSTERAFELSREMMRGQKWNTFVLGLSFILWNILGFITCIGHYFIRPYIKATEMELYTFLKNDIKQRGITNDFELSGFYKE
ncbi:DUF975 family protein [Anaerosacchariphilus polymeriproducens]|uniref:DUF975 family protein n=1 Tax=Anaerosacchariphilus polymeriproducens TaxID=1812858 RepID=A0A371AUS6_9FIRM|nr:DUF975 family protein [Anaerosacchariphilus polymeriproducens]RDU23325.1 DUF975 family protein [Anaerosacchariphilus polymeriproducens]